MPYISNTDDDQREMLSKIGVTNIEELFSNIPDELRLKQELKIPALSEMELMAEMERMAHGTSDSLTCFAGGGVYDHFIPTAVNAIITRPEFVTAYTPYQPEVAQGTLQVIYEFQTHICRLTDMDIANASMYDGATAAAEALCLAMRITKRSRVIVADSVNPLYRQVIKTTLDGLGAEIVPIPILGGQSDLTKLADLVDENTAAVLVAQPNFFGSLEDMDTVGEIIHKVGGKFISISDPIVQAITKTPGAYGADIVVGEAQPFGIPLSFGGPLLGFFAARQELARFMPGRISGRTKDLDGKPGFVLTLQTREQHIRREKATSNICTNQALCATAASVYLSLMGKQGLKQVALLSLEKAHQAARKICSLDGYSLYFDTPFVRELAIKTPHPAAEIVMAMTKEGILPGIDAGRWYPDMQDCLIVALTEKRTDEEIERLVCSLEKMAVNDVVSQM